MAVLGRSRPNRPIYLKPVPADAAAPPGAAPTVITAGHNGAGAATAQVNVAADAGDTLIVIHFNNYYTITSWADPTFSAGVGSLTSLGTVDSAPGVNTGNTIAHIRTWTAPVTSTGTKTVTFAPKTDEEHVGVVLVVRNYDSVDAAFSGGFDITASAYDTIAPSVSPTTANALLICGVMTRGDNLTGYATWTPPGSMTERADRKVSPFLSASVATQELTASGATGTQTFTPATAAGATGSAWFSIALKGAAGGPVTHEGAVSMAGAGGLTATAEVVKHGIVNMAGAGQLAATGVREQPATAAMAGVGQLTATGVSTDHGQTNLTGVGLLTAVAVREQFGVAALAGVGLLTAIAVREQPATVALAGVGALTAAAQVLVEHVGVVALAGAGQLTADATVVSYDHTGYLYAGSATEVSGTWVDEPNAIGPSTGDYATWTTDTAGEAALELAGFAAQAGIPAGSTIGPVEVLVRHAEDAEVTSVTAQAYLGATPHGSPATLTVDPAIHEDIVTVTDLDWADLADLRIQVTAVRT